MRRIGAVSALVIAALASSPASAAQSKNQVIKTTFASGATCSLTVAARPTKANPAALAPLTALVERKDGVAFKYDFSKNTVTQFKKKGSGDLKQVGQPKKMESVVYLVRGVVGSGHDALAQRLVKSDASIFSTDKFWVGKDGQYKFDRSKLGASHAWAQQQAAKAMRSGLSPIAINNTMVRASEARPYIENALENGYRIEIRQPRSTKWDAAKLARSKANKFGIPEEIIQRQIANYEPGISIASILSMPSFGTRPAKAAKTNQGEPSKGDRVQLSNGVSGTVFWIGPSKFGRGNRVGVRDADGNVHWADAAKVSPI